MAKGKYQIKCPHCQKTICLIVGEKFELSSPIPLAPSEAQVELNRRTKSMVGMIATLRKRLRECKQQDK